MKLCLQNTSRDLIAIYSVFELLYLRKYTKLSYSYSVEFETHTHEMNMLNGASRDMLVKN